MTSTATIHYLGHATLLIEIDGVAVLTDPVAGDRVLYLRRIGPSGHPWLRDLPDPDLILLSHLHLDHFHLPTLRRLPRDIPLIAPAETVPFLKHIIPQNMEGLSPGESKRLGGVEIHAVPARHGRNWLRTPLDAAQGYVVHGSKTIYFAGDTDIFPEMREIGDMGLDLALLPIWGWGPRLGAGHLDPAGAVEAIKLLRPRRVAAIHWGSFNLIGGQLLGLRAHLIDPGDRFQRLARERVPETTIILPKPGEAFGLD
ncbi:MAG: MBL fold metallo-hydrolase [Chloroflexi bacterium]|nr:MBL fold metallo-hydrolase [Chloroflexota bacterium]